jgi:hypothetical protein
MTPTGKPRVGVFFWVTEQDCLLENKMVIQVVASVVLLVSSTYAGTCAEVSRSLDVPMMLGIIPRSGV